MALAISSAAQRSGTKFCCSYNLENAKVADHLNPAPQRQKPLTEMPSSSNAASEIVSQALDTLHPLDLHSSKTLLDSFQTFLDRANTWQREQQCVLDEVNAQITKTPVGGNDGDANIELGACEYRGDKCGSCGSFLASFDLQHLSTNESTTRFPDPQNDPKHSFLDLSVANGVLPNTTHAQASAGEYSFESWFRSNTVGPPQQSQRLLDYSIDPTKTLVNELPSLNQNHICKHTFGTNSCSPIDIAGATSANTVAGQAEPRERNSIGQYCQVWKPIATSYENSPVDCEENVYKSTNDPGIALPTSSSICDPYISTKDMNLFFERAKTEPKQLWKPAHRILAKARVFFEEKLGSRKSRTYELVRALRGIIQAHDFNPHSITHLWDDRSRTPVSSNADCYARSRQLYEGHFRIKEARDVHTYANRLCYIFLEHDLQQLAQSPTLEVSQGRGRMTAALERQARNISKPVEAIRTARKAGRGYVQVLMEGGPGYLIHLGNHVSTFWERRLSRTDISLLLEFIQLFLPKLHRKVMDSNVLATQSILKGFAAYGWTPAEIATTNSKLIDKLKTYVEISEESFGTETIPEHHSEQFTNLPRPARECIVPHSGVEGGELEKNIYEDTNGDSQLEIDTSPSQYTDSPEALARYCESQTGDGKVSQKHSDLSHQTPTFCDVLKHFEAECEFMSDPMDYNMMDFGGLELGPLNSV